MYISAKRSRNIRGFFRVWANPLSDRETSAEVSDAKKNATAFMLVLSSRLEGAVINLHTSYKLWYLYDTAILAKNTKKYNNQNNYRKIFFYTRDIAKEKSK